MSDDEETEPDRHVQTPLETVAAIVLWLVRGTLLWLILPCAFLGWILVHWWAQRASPPQTAAWYDANVVAALTRGPLRPLLHRELRAPFVGIRSMRDIEPHDMRPIPLDLLDLWASP